MEEVEVQHALNLVSKAVKKVAFALYEKHPEYQDKHEYELRDILNPSVMADRMRVSFWEEYLRAKDTGKRMVMEKVFEPFMSHRNFYDYFIQNDSNLAWMLSPPSEHFMAMKADLYRGRDELGKILRMPLFDTEGNLKLQEARVFIKVFEIYSNRLFGSAIQRIEQKTATLHVSDLSGDPDELRKELEARKSARGIIEVDDGKETS